MKTKTTHAPYQCLVPTEQKDKANKWTWLLLPAWGCPHLKGQLLIHIIEHTLLINNVIVNVCCNQIWNKLPENRKRAETLCAFKSRLKTLNPHLELLLKRSRWNINQQSDVYRWHLTKCNVSVADCVLWLCMSVFLWDKTLWNALLLKSAIQIALINQSTWLIDQS